LKLDDLLNRIRLLGTQLQSLQTQITALALRTTTIEANAALGGVTYDISNTAWTVSTSYSSIGISITLPAGSWLIHARGQFDWSEGTVQRKQAQIYNSTDAVEVDSVETNTGALAGQATFYMMSPVTISATKTFELRLKVTAVTGAQLIGGPRIWATPVAAFF